MRKAAVVAAFLVVLLLIGCEAAVIKEETVAPSSSFTPERTPIPVPLPSNYTPKPMPALTPIPTPNEPERTLSPIHPDLLPLVVYDSPPSKANDPAPALPFDINIIPNDKPEFNPDDLIAGDLRHGMTQKDVLDIMGLPTIAYAYMDGMYAIEHLVLYYENGDRISFWNEYDENYFLHSVSIFSGLSGPRGLSVGDALEDVINAYRVDPESAGPLPYGDGTVLYANEPYRGDHESGTDYLISPYGLLTYSGYYEYGGVPCGMPMVEYRYPSEPFTYDDLWEHEYHFRWFYTCKFYFENGRVVYYNWNFS